MTSRNEPCPCGSQKKYKKCCLSQPARSLVKTSDEIKKMRRAGKLAALVLNETGRLVAPGVSTSDLNDFAHQLTLKHGATSAPLGYRPSPEDVPFPKSICTSVNEVVAHGIPSVDVILKQGDIVNIDVTVKLDGYHGDTSRTFIVGEVADEVKKLVERTQQALFEGIKAVKPGNWTNDIGLAIESFIKPFGYGIVRELVGHGIGRGFHESPSIHHYYQRVDKIELVPGMTFTIEPMINLGRPDVVLLEDQWTIVTRDSKPSAQFEHTILVTETGSEILTALAP